MSSAGVITTINPATGEVLQAYDAYSSEKIDSIVAAVNHAGVSWANTTVYRRAEQLRALGAQIRTQRVELAELMVAEMGKPISEALAEVDKCATVCDYYAETGQWVLAPQKVQTEAADSWTEHEPIGTVLAIMPWNFPYWQVLRFAAPTLMAGNTGILKHSPNVTGCALAIEQVFINAGLPENVFRTIVIDEPNVPAETARLVSDDRIAAVTITGSERAGTAIASVAGANVKKSVLELGGSDPFIVLADADLALAASSAVRSRFINGGQSCLAAKRFIVNESVLDEFLNLFAAAVKDLKVGDPTDPSTVIGPMARADLVAGIDKQVKASVAEGATVVTGGKAPERQGAWYEPTVLSNVSENMAVMVEETFGPVAAVISVPNDDEAVRVANSSRYGLAASVWSKDSKHALAVGRRVTSGALFVNQVVASDSRLPFGGTKKSGYGRELGAAGAVEFTNLRTYVIGTGAAPTGVATE